MMIDKVLSKRLTILVEHKLPKETSSKRKVRSTIPRGLCTDRCPSAKTKRIGISTRGTPHYEWSGVEGANSWKKRKILKNDTI